MICERCQTEDPTVTDRRACMVAHCDGECLAGCRACMSELADEWGNE